MTPDPTEVPKHLLVPGQWVKIGWEGFQLSLKIDRSATYDGIIEVWGSEFVWEPTPPEHTHAANAKGYHLIMAGQMVTLKPLS